MERKTYPCTLVGTSPLIMHNGQLSDPMYQFTVAIKAVQGKRNKTEADMEELLRLQWMGGLYVKNGTIIIPAYVIKAMLINSSKKMKLGKNAGAGLVVEDDSILKFPDQGMSLGSLYQDKYRLTRLVVINRSRVVSCRPIFPEWSIDLDLHYYDDLFDLNQVKQVLEIGGNQVGLGDWRPEKYGNYGMFTVADRQV